MESSPKFMFYRKLEKRSKESKKRRKFDLKIRAADLAKAGSADCLKNVAIFKSYVTTKAEKSLWKIKFKNVAT